MSRFVSPLIRTPARFAATDGRVLHGYWSAPDDKPRMAVVLHAATGVPAGYYRAFVEWLALAHGAAVLAYDYRDWGEGLDRPLREVQTRMSDWGLLDQDAALSHAVAAFPNLPIRVVGHSLGGHWLAFHDRIDRVDRVVTVASGPAHWLAHPLSKLPRVLSLWWLAGPAATLALGYLPGRRLGLGADLPAGVFWQWRRWCLRQGYSSSDWGARLPEPDLDKARFDLDLIAIADDWMIPPGVVWRLADFYPKALVKRTLVEPKAFGLDAIGHLAVFRDRNRAAWPLIAASLTP